ncbi:MAG: single-stranded DNA-binding protein, partial [Thermoanaerobaculia bacterium]|nr:single-stranded DNA-binding protein [Thermoanaerobaculia bacterium]
KKYRTEIVASTMKMLDRKGDGDEGGGYASSGASKSSGSAPARPGEEDDEVPF